MVAGKKHGNQRLISVLLDEETAALVGELAARNDRTTSWILRKAVRGGLPGVKEALSTNKVLP